MIAQELIHFVDDSKTENDHLLTNIITPSGSYSGYIAPSGSTVIQPTRPSVWLHLTGVLASCFIMFSIITLVASIYARIIWLIVISSIILFVSLLLMLHWIGLPILTWISKCKK
jgi:hypothetical protein